MQHGFARSCVSLGYFEDRFVRYFVPAPTRRAPLINRGLLPIEVGPGTQHRECPALQDPYCIRPPRALYVRLLVSQSFIRAVTMVGSGVHSRVLLAR